jgi:two-component system, NarL family, sensor kinase
MRQLLSNPIWWIVLAFIIILSLELIAPNQYVISYAFIVPILFATYQTNSRWSCWVTIAAIFCTLMSGWIWLPENLPQIQSDLFVNRAIVAISLPIVAWMSGDNPRQYPESIASERVALDRQSRTIGLRTDFINTLVHDLKTPLLGAIETINTFQRGDFGTVTPPQARALAVMNRSHRSSVHQIQTILDVYSSDENGLSLNYQASDLATIASDAISTLTDLAANRQVQIQLVNEIENTQLSCDPCRIGRVFTNLLMNAIYQSPPKSEVTVHIIDRTTDYYVQIIDRGRGIKPADLPHLFNKFYQNQINRHAKGAGLGLYLSKQIIETHGGEILVEAVVPTGATFSFTIPKAAESLIEPNFMLS